MDQISRARLVPERAQPLQQLGWIGVVAELFEGHDLGADGDNLSVDLHFRGAALDGGAAGSGRLESNEHHRIPGIRKSLRQMMLYTPTRYHAARRNNDRREFRIVDFL